MEEKALHVIPLDFVVKQDFLVSGGCLWKFRDQLLQLFENHVFTGTAEDLLVHLVQSSALKLGRTALQLLLTSQLRGSDLLKMPLNTGGLGV